MTSGITSGAVIIKAKPFDPRKRPKRTITTAAIVPRIAAAVAAQVGDGQTQPDGAHHRIIMEQFAVPARRPPAHTVTSFELLNE
jgi:hypothetical protein